MASKMSAASVGRTASQSPRILPGGSAPAERIGLFTNAIGKLRQNTDGGGLQDAKAIVRVCARAAGYHGKLFEADRQRARRS